MHYTPGQLRETVGLSKEAFRHWKRVVPAFTNGRGHAPSFSSGDILATAVLLQLTDIIGVRIGHLSEIAPAIFHVCNASSWDALKNKSLVINLQERSCVAVDDQSIPGGELIVVCALAPLVRMLHFGLLNSNAQSRPNAPYPVAVGNRVRK